MTGEGATAGGLTRLGLVNRMVPVEQFDAGAEASCGGCDRTEGPPDGSQREGASGVTSCGAPFSTAPPRLRRAGRPR
jgi:hypothetical protein